MQAPNTPSSQITQMMEPPESPPFPSSDFSIPLTMAMIGIISTALSITLYHLVVSKLCVQRGHNHRDTAANEIPSGVDQKVLNSIPIQAYSHKHSASCVSDQCAVCLTEFEEGDSARLLPNCQHLFHLQCIDAWFVSHSSCPMCRSPVLPVIIDADAARLPQQSVNQGSIVISIEEDDNVSAHNSRRSAASSSCHCSSLCFERKPQTRFLPPLHKRSLSDCSFVSAKTRLKDEHGPTSWLSSTSLEVQNIRCSSWARESC